MLPTYVFRHRAVFLYHLVGSWAWELSFYL
jgi:hypothetical protein